ncbi:transcriptional repressor general negative regulator of transcription subunit 4 [Geranomyces michiganensis]|nr:transcriptional repressor general negative regulator of transcription subunit 4 [Geranomyces michiganensis]
MSSDEEDLECPLCMEEIDISDKYFKPCPCGYQICRFCWNHIKEHMNGLCPACRRPYSEDTVEFKPVPPEEISRIKALKKRREREKREQSERSRQNMANARVVQKNLVYVLGLPAKIATEDHLRTQEYFGQYGKIIRVMVNRRAHGHTPVLAQVPNTGVYITFQKKEDAAKAIEAVDGSVYDGKIIRATYGTTKYCSYFLKNQTCQNPACQFLHEPGEEPDSFAQDELSRMQIRERNPKPPPFPVTWGEKKEDKDQSALPATASWAKPVARPAGGQYNASTSPQLSAATPGTPRSPDSDGDEYEATANLTRGPKLGSSSQASSRAEAKGKGSAKSQSDLPPGLAAGSLHGPPEIFPALAPEEEQVMGSSALDENHEQPDLSQNKAGSPRASVNGDGDDFGQSSQQDEQDDSFSLAAMGFILHPKYIGPFDPFRDEPLAIFAGLAVISEEAMRYGALNGTMNAGLQGSDLDSQTVRSSSRASDNGQRSRFERFFGGAQGADGQAFDGVPEKKEDVKSVQESFRAMFPNVNVSFASGSLSDAEARWGESFSPSKLAVQDAPAEGWSQGQGYGQLRQQQQQQAPFPSGTRGGISAQYGTRDLALRQEQLLQQQQQQQQQQQHQQQQFVSPLAHGGSVQPHLLNQFQQQFRLAQMQQPGHFPGSHNMHGGGQPQEELMGHVLRDAQLRESQLRENQVRQELQLRAAAAGGASGAPGFEGRGRPRNFDGGNPAQSMAYQQDWPSAPSSSAAMAAAYGASARLGRWLSAAFDKKEGNAEFCSMACVTMLDVSGIVINLSSSSSFFYLSFSSRFSFIALCIFQQPQQITSNLFICGDLRNKKGLESGPMSLREKDMREGLVRQYLREREVRLQAQQDQFRERQRDQERRDLVAERVAAMMARGVGEGGGPPGMLALGGEGEGEGEGGGGDGEWEHGVEGLGGSDSNNTIGYVLAEQLFEEERKEEGGMGCEVTAGKDDDGRAKSPNKESPARERQAQERDKIKRELSKRKNKDAAPVSPTGQRDADVIETPNASPPTRVAADFPPTPIALSPKPATASVSAPAAVAAATISSPTLRRVLTITPAKKPPVVAVPEPEPVVAAKPAAPAGRRSAARAAKSAAAVAAATVGKDRPALSSDDKSFDPVASISKRASKSKLDESSASASSERQRLAVVAIPVPEAEPEVEAILGRKPKKRKEKKVAVPRPSTAVTASKTAALTAVAAAEATASASPVGTSPASLTPLSTPQQTTSVPKETPAVDSAAEKLATMGKKHGGAKLTPELVEFLEQFVAKCKDQDPSGITDILKRFTTKSRVAIDAGDENLAESAMQEYLEELAADQAAQAALNAAPPVATRSRILAASMGRKIATPKPIVDRKSAPGAGSQKSQHAAQPQKQQQQQRAGMPIQEQQSRAVTGEVDNTSLVAGPDGGEVDVEIDTEVLANALSQLTAGYAEYVAQNHSSGSRDLTSDERLDEAHADDDDEEGDDEDDDFDATASFDLDALGVDLGQLDALAAGLGHHVVAAGEHPGSSLSVDVDGVPVTIDANAFIDQALEGLASTAAFLYEGLEAQAEKVRVHAEKTRRLHEVKGKLKDMVNASARARSGDDAATKDNIDKVAEQITKLEQYAAKMQQRVHTDTDGLSAAAMAGKASGKGKGSVAARKNTPAATANWTTEDWKAKCRSVEVVMKRVREARDMRRRQKESAVGAGPAGPGGIEQPGPSVVALADVLNMSVDVAAVVGLDRPGGYDDHQDDDDDNHRCGLCQSDDAVAGRADGASPAELVSADIEGDVASLWSLESSHMQRLLETVRLLVSSGEMLASTPSPTAVNCVIPTTAHTSSSTSARAAGMHSRKKRRKVAGPAPPPPSLPLASRRGRMSVAAPSSSTSNPQILFDAEIMVYLRDLVNASGPAGPATATLTTFNSRGNPEPIVFDPARLLAGIADGVIDFGTPIPWEMLGLSGPPRSSPVSKATTPSPPPLPTDGDESESGDGDDCSSEDVDNTPPSGRSRGNAGADDNLAMLEARLAESRRLERDLERHLAGAVASNRAWTAEVAEALDLDTRVVDVVTALPFEMGEGYLALIPPATAAGSSGSSERVCVHRHDARGVHVDRSGRPLGMHACGMQHALVSCTLKRSATLPPPAPFPVGKQLDPAATTTQRANAPTTTPAASAATTTTFFPAEPIVVDAKVLLDTPGFGYDFAQRHNMTSPTCSLD